MKKLIAGGVVASALALGSLTGGAAHAYGPVVPPVQPPAPITSTAPALPTAHAVKTDVAKAVAKKGHLSKKKATKLTAEVKAAKKAGTLSPKQAKKLLAKIKKDAK